MNGGYIMKRLIAIAVVLFAVTAASNAQYSTSSNYRYWTIAPTAGITMPMQNLDDRYNSGYNIGVDVGYRMSQSMGVFGNVNYNNLSGEGINSSANYLEITAGPRFFLGGSANTSAFWIDGGVGAYNLSDGGIGSGPTNAGLTAGIGYSVPLSETISLMGKGKYNMVFTANEPTTFSTLSAGVRFILK
ncbi:MAG: hypothetical protein EHM58_17780 [Ignavibacteriae bacterium]|nr:MAG: hypothetical protein EHM58_17780 [Ignavibacteriota bacterium]